MISCYISDDPQVTQYNPICEKPVQPHPIGMYEHNPLAFDVAFLLVAMLAFKGVRKAIAKTLGFGCWHKREGWRDSATLPGMIVNVCRKCGHAKVKVRLYHP